VTSVSIKIKRLVIFRQPFFFYFKSLSILLQIRLQIFHRVSNIIVLLLAGNLPFDRHRPTESARIESSQQHGLVVIREGLNFCTLLEQCKLFRGEKP
jgi:hypothetical protein